MYRKLIVNDFKKSKLITATIAVFIFVAALLTSTAASLAVNLFSAVDGLMRASKASHYLQMHTGDIDFARLRAFAEENGNVEAYQVVDFLNIEGSEITVGGHSLIDSVQDNGLCVQGGQFDYLFDLNGEMVFPADDEIYLPIYYMKEYRTKIGDSATVCGVPFTVAGFLRDSGMSSSMAGSKRFLVSESTLERLRPLGKAEHIIEFRLLDGSAIPAFETAYRSAGLEANGPPGVTYPLVRMMNGVSDGIMIAVLVLAGILVLAVAFLCVRFTLLAKIEEEYKEIGVLKAIGLRTASIKRLYLAKYGLVAAAASALGFAASLFLGRLLMENIRLYMGESEHIPVSLLVGAVGAASVCLVTLLYVNGVLRRFRNLSASQAIRFGAPREKAGASARFCLSRKRLLSTNVFLGVKDILCRKKLYVTMLLVVIISAFLLVVPQNIYNTISSRSFMTYLGFGNCDLRLDIQQVLTDRVLEDAAAAGELAARDSRIAAHTMLASYQFDVRMEDGATDQMKVELGDHAAFPLTYSKGRAPQSDTEIALTVLLADDLGKAVGDTIPMVVDGEERLLTICGLYSDISNGGRNAKAAFQTNRTDALWVTIPIRLRDRGLLEETYLQYKQQLPFAKVSNVDDYISQLFGTMQAAVQKASYAAIAASAILVILITLLFMKMLVAKDRYPIAVLKASGFTSSAIERQYFVRAAVVLLLGAVGGAILANTLGELVGGAIISSIGVSTFHFVVNPAFAYLFSPLLMMACVALATLLGVSGIRTVRVSEYIKEQ